MLAHLISYADLPFFSLVVPEAENHNYLLSHQKYKHIISLFILLHFIVVDAFFMRWICIHISAFISIPYQNPKFETWSYSDSNSSSHSEVFVMISGSSFQGRTHCHGQLGCKLQWIQQEVLSTFMSILYLPMSIVTLNRQTF